MKNRHILPILCCFISLAAGAAQTDVLYLSGKGSDDMMQWDFRCSAGANSGNWRKIGVPSQWELQGFGEYTYGRYYFNDKNAQPSNETGEYRYRFKVPSSWKGKAVDIVFDGVMTDALVKVNGTIAGEVHQGAFYRFSYRISSLLKYGSTNLLEVSVKKQSDNSSVNAAERRADWWLFGGIFRPVWLRAMPVAHIEHIALNPEADGTLSATIETQQAPRGALIRYRLSDAKGKELGTRTIALSDSQTMKWDGIIPWECEHPTLYDISVTLADKDGRELHSIQKRIGFRTVELRKMDGLYVNGTKVILKGVNRHCFHPESGRTTSSAQDLEDARLIKQMNMNAIRSHYPPDERFLDICDSLGLFYLDELAGWHGRYDNEVGPKLVREMVSRDVNHPSVIIWNNGNEGGWNTSLDSLFYKHDPQKRHVIHPWADFDGLDTHHYPAFLTGVHRFTNGYKVFMPTEFLHANYDEGGGAGLEDFWDNYTSHPLCAGGFIWAFVDEAVMRTDKGNILDAYGNMGNDGIVGPYREKEGSFWAIRNIWAPIQFEKTFITSSFKGDFIIRNGYLFTNLDKCSMKYTIKSIGTPAEGAREKVMASGAIALPSVEPGLSARINFEMPDNFFDGDLLEIEAFSEKGESICTWSWPIHYASDYLSRHKCTGTAGVTVDFNEKTGNIDRITKDGRVIPLTNFRPVGMKWHFQKAYSANDGDDRIFVAKYKGGVDSVVWRLTADGRLGMDAVILNKDNGGGGLDDAFMDSDIRYIGFTFDFPEDEVKGMQWFGRGPYRVWKNRIRGHEFGLWHKDYNNTITGETDVPQGRLEYPEFKGYHAGIYWARIESETSPFTLYSGTDGLFLRMLTPEQPHGLAKGTSNPEFPEGDISLLLDIPAIKSFKSVAQHGPKSQPGNVRIKAGDEGIRISIWFDFSDEPELKATARPEAGSTRIGNNPVLFLVGDSTMRNGRKGNGDNGQWGWGAFAKDYFDTDRITVENHALGGLSSRTFYRDCWPSVVEGVKKGDYVIIQLGHNDSGPVDEGRARNSLPGTDGKSVEVTIKESGVKETVYSYGEYIRRMVKEVLAKGAYPLVFSLTPRPFWNEDGSIVRKTGTFTSWAAAIAEEMNVPFVDLEDISASRFETYGKEKTEQMFYGDRIHTSRFGAVENARSAAEGILKSGSRLKDYLAYQVMESQQYAREEGKPALFLTGDSTMKNNDSGPDSMWGWGSVVAEFFDAGRISTVNAGMPGRSARTFLNEGRWDKVYNSLKPGDFVVIQFGHNDMGNISSGKERGELPGASSESKVFRICSDGRYEVVWSYGWYLEKFIRDVREKGATPILLSITPRNKWTDSKIERRNDSYGAWLAEVVRNTGVDFVDVHNISADFFDSIGWEAAAEYFRNDHTHTSFKGAVRNAVSFTEGLVSQSHPLSLFLKK